jgi:hypothetical protein
MTRARTAPGHKQKSSTFLLGTRHGKEDALLVALVLPDICACYRGKPCGDD